MGSRYESLVFDVIPADCKRVLDVGCGNGEITRRLRDRGIPKVVGLDRDEPCIQRCRDHPEVGNIRYILGDVLSSDLEPASFDLVSAVASLHHLDARSGLVRLRSLIAPGGALVVIGLARPDLPKDLPLVVAQIVSRIQRRTGQPDRVPQAPIVWPPPERHSTMRRLTNELLPGVRWQRHLLWWYSLVWTNAAA